MTQVAGVTISKNIKSLTQTAIVEFPKNVLFSNDSKKRLAEVLKTGDKVSIRLGYNNVLNTEFVGYIARIEQSVPIRIHCEDEMFTLKRKTITPKTFAAATLGDVIDYVAVGVPVNIVDRSIKLGKFSMDKVSPATVLKYISDNYSLVCFFKEGVLVVGFPYSFTAQAKVFVYDFQQNIADNNLEYQRTDTSKIVIKAISNLKTGKKITVWLPYKGAEGDVRSLNFGEMTEAELRVHAEAELVRYSYDGYKGAVTGFGFPFVQITEVVQLRDRNFADQEGTYFVDAVEVEFNTDSFRRKCTIGKTAK